MIGVTTVLGAEPNKYRLELLLTVIICIVCAVNAESLVKISSLRYLSYLLPLIFIAQPTQKYITLNPPYSQTVLIGVIFITTTIACISGGPENYKYLIFTAYAFLPYRRIISIKEEIIPMLIISLGAVQLLLSAGDTSALTKFFNQAAFDQGSAATTHTIPGVLGILLGAALATGRKKLALLCFALILTAGKRGVLLASLGSTALLYAYPKSPSWIKNRRVALPIILTIIGSTLTLKLPEIYLETSYQSGIDIDILTSGRYTGQIPVYERLDERPLINDAIGDGAGTADHLAWIGFQGVTTLVHSDYLRILTDYGYLIGLAFAVSYLSVINIGKIGPYLVFYSAYLWLTENSLINVLITAMMYICICSSVKGNPRRGQGRREEERGL